LRDHVAMSDRYFTCKCFLTDNYFVRSIGSHVVFNDRESFLSEYAEVHCLRYVVFMIALCALDYVILNEIK
jgi:hypothetical protein